MEKLIRNLKKLKGNREKVGIDVLKTRYAASYKALLDEIRADAETLQTKLLFGGLPYLSGDDKSKTFELFVMEAQKIIDEETDIRQQFARKIFVEYDVDGAAGVLLDRLAPRIKYEAYGLTYWLDHCSERDGRYYNDIIRMWWCPEVGCWQSVEDGIVTFRHLPPPTETLIRLVMWKYRRVEGSGR